MLAQAVNYITLDIAPIDAKKLRMSRPNFMHVRAHAEMLPLKDDSFDLIVSNLAIDFAPRKALGHVAQALRRKSPEYPAGGTFCINLHHPSMMRAIIAGNTDEFVEQFINSGLSASNSPDTVKFYESTDEIRSVFAQYGLAVESVEEVREERTNDAWWRVIGKRAA
jgi:ubiquinone/menaquinone biosynthesis C-methylase UbiE